MCLRNQNLSNVVDITEYFFYLRTPLPSDWDTRDEANSGHSDCLRGIFCVPAKLYACTRGLAGTIHGRAASHSGNRFFSNSKMMDTNNAECGVRY